MEDVRCNHAVEAYRLATANHDQGAGHGRKSYGEQRHTVRDRCPCAAEAAAWNRGSAAEFADRALPDISFTNIFGMFSVGNGPFVAQHERIFSTIYKGSTNHLQIEHITLVKPDVAIVDILTVVTGAQHPPPGVQFIDGALRSRLQQVLVRQADGWWLASFHNVAVNPAYPPKP